MKSNHRRADDGRMEVDAELLAKLSERREKAEKLSRPTPPRMSALWRKVIGELKKC